MCCILVYSLLVVFPKYYQLRNSLFTEQGKAGKTEIQSKENHATKMTKKTKTKLPKFVMSQAKIANVERWRWLLKKNTYL